MKIDATILAADIFQCKSLEEHISINTAVRGRGLALINLSERAQMIPFDESRVFEPEFLWRE